MRIRRFSQRFVISAKDGNYTDGSGLWLDVRNGGKAKSWSLRFGGQRVSPPGGSAQRISVEQAQAFVRQCRDQLARDEDPFAGRVQVKQAESETDIPTFIDCAKAYYAHKAAIDWGHSAQGVHRGIIKNFLESVPFKNLPVRDITGTHIETILQPIWVPKPVIAKRTAQFLRGMFRWARAKKTPSGLRWYSGENPAVTTKDSDLAIVLGSQPRSHGHHEELAVKMFPS